MRYTFGCPKLANANETFLPMGPLDSGSLRSMSRHFALPILIFSWVIQSTLTPLPRGYLIAIVIEA
jgi:hypothetical protein